MTAPKTTQPIHTGPHPSAMIGGTQRIYRWGDGGLSIVNGSMLHGYPFHSEAAVVRFTGPNARDFALDYSTPLTSDVEVFLNAQEEADFIAKAEAYFEAVQS